MMPDSSSSLSLHPGQWSFRRCGLFQWRHPNSSHTLQSIYVFSHESQMWGLVSKYLASHTLQ